MGPNIAASQNFLGTKSIWWRGGRVTRDTTSDESMLLAYTSHNQMTNQNIVDEIWSAVYQGVCPR
jgi:hypothetical protein